MSDKKDNVLPFTGWTTVDLEPDVVLEGAKGKLTEVVVLGRNEDGQLVFASNTVSLKDSVFLMERGIREAMDIVIQREIEIKNNEG